jgi:hypothetical protein
MSTERFDALDELCTSQFQSMSSDFISSDSDIMTSQEELKRMTQTSPTRVLNYSYFTILQFKMKDPLYKLSQECAPPHQSDVKAVIPLPGDRIATASRDQSVGIWKRGEVRFRYTSFSIPSHAHGDGKAYDRHQISCRAC